MSHVTSDTSAIDDSASSVCSPISSRPETPKSDTELEYSERKMAEAAPIQQWNWGELPESSQNLSQMVVSQQSEPIDDSQSNLPGQ